MSSADTGSGATDQASLISAGRVNGTSVYGRSGERLGSVHDLIIDKVTGRVAYAIMSFGGFLGMGEHYHPLPWESLSYDTALGGYAVDVTREQLEGAPSHRHDETPWVDPAYERLITEYYTAGGTRGI